MPRVEPLAGERLVVVTRAIGQYCRSAKPVTSNRAHLSQRKFSVRRIIEANSRSRAASQGGSRWASGRNDLDAATGDSQSKPDSRARSHATADRLRIIRARCRCLFTDCPCPCLVTDMGCSWKRTFARTEYDRGLFADKDGLRSEPVRDRSAYATADWPRTVCVRFR